MSEEAGGQREGLGEVPAWGRGHMAQLDYHARLVGDPVRMEAYERALRRLVKPGMVVLDLGAGTGVLAMLAARLGAARVHAVESAAVAGLAAELVRDNGLEDRVVVHHADATTMEVVEPVDLLVSDYMGRFVVDDGMLWALAAGGRWLKPGGLCCPAAVTLRIAPVGIGYFGPLDVFEQPILGLQMGAARERSRRWCHGADLPGNAVLAEPWDYHHIRGTDAGGAFEGRHSFEVRTGGRLRALAGWFSAELAPAVVLDTAPGSNTHWGQWIFPLPVVEVQPGDRVEARVWLVSSEPFCWGWEGKVRLGSGEVVVFSERSDGLGGGGEAAGQVGAEAPGGSAEELNELGAAAFRRGELQEAALHFEAAVRALGPGDGGLAEPVWENLGLAYAMSGRYRQAVGPLLRALDGDPASREQSARLVVDACFRGGLTMRGEEALAAYEAAFGPHPSGWKQG